MPEDTRRASRPLAGGIRGALAVWLASLAAYGLNQVLPEHLVPPDYLLVGVIAGALLTVGKALRDRGLGVLTPIVLALLLLGCSAKFGKNVGWDAAGSFCLGASRTPIGTFALGWGEFSCSDTLDTERPAVVVSSPPQDELVNDGE